ncbi:MAG TPA: hypothetical protein VFZ73_16610, partial [Gemmatimonadaceae bacterium]
MIFDSSRVQTLPDLGDRPGRVPPGGLPLDRVTGQRQLITRTRPLDYPLEGIAWSLDGKSIAANGGSYQELRGQVVIVDVASATETVLPTPDWRAVSRVAW